MVASNFDKSLNYAFRSEGGYVDDPKDRGGATNLGVTFKVLQAYRGRPITKEDVKRLTKAEAGEIYRKQYWDAVKADDLPSGVDYFLFDFAINSGPARAVISLQRVLRVKQDGILGLLTLDKLKELDVIDVIDKLWEERLRFLKQTHGWARFGKGWNKRVVEATLKAKRMAGQCPKIDVELTEQPTNRKAQKISVAKTKTGKTIIASSLGAVGVTATAISDQLQPLTELSQTIKYIAIGLTIIGVVAGAYLKFKEVNEQVM